MAFVVAIHDIEDTRRFRRATSSESLAEVRLCRVYPLVNGVKAVSLWEGASVDSVGDFVDALLGARNRTEFYEVDPSSALGLPDACATPTKRSLKWRMR